MKNRRCNLKRWINKVFIWAINLLYYQLAWAYDAVAWMVSFGHWQEWRHHALDHIKPGHILEVGFGTGELLLKMAELGSNVIGLERSEQMQNVVKRKLKRKGYQIKRVQSCVEAIPFSGQVFDNVISTFPSGLYIERRNTTRSISGTQGEWTDGGGWFIRHIQIGTAKVVDTLVFRGRRRNLFSRFYFTRRTNRF